MTDQFFSMLEFACKFDDLENRGGGEKILANRAFFFFFFPKYQVCMSISYVPPMTAK